MLGAGRPYDCLDPPGTVAPSFILKKLAAYRRQNRLDLAIQEIGRIVRTLFTLDWLDFGLKEHDRLLIAKERMERVLRGRRASSKLPALVDLVLSRPLVSTGTIQKALKVLRQGALDLIGEISLREMTGRGSFRAWGIV
ncbi:MAG: hypothetical protein EOS22_03600 [Mesorhizobium sp.]|nr:MAG: hypothetical protein EOS22_03600 [Mesorhizobium sp.]